MNLLLNVTKALTFVNPILNKLFVISHSHILCSKVTTVLCDNAKINLP